MDFALDPEQELLRTTARDVLAATVTMRDVRALLDDPRGTTDTVWQRMAALGWLGMTLPEEHGGAGLGLLELALLLEEMGRALVPGPFLSTVLASRALLHAGDARQQARWLPGIAAGTCVATLAVLEESARWDAAGVSAVARPAGAGVALAGTKLFVPDAAAADLLVVALRRADDGELVLVVVERTTPGVAVTALAGVDQTRKVFAVDLDGVRVPADHVLAGDAPAALARILDEGRVALAAEMGGGAARVLAMTVEHARTRRQFERPIGSFQAVQHACADMMVAVERIQAAVRYAAWAASAGAPDAARAAAMAKAIASDAYRQVTAKAVQIHGGIGFTWEHDLHLYFKRALASGATLGDGAWNRELVAQHLGL